MRPIWTCVVLCAVIVGCADPPKQEASKASRVVGTWTGADPEGTEFDWVFHDDGTWTMLGHGRAWSGPYTIEGNAISGTTPNEQRFSGTVDGETMVLAGPEGKDPITLVFKSRAIDHERIRRARASFEDLGKLSHVMIDTRDPAITVVTGVPKDATAEQMAEIRKQVDSDEGIELVGWTEFKPEARARLAARIVVDDYGMIARLGELVRGVQNRAGVPVGLTWNGGIAITALDYRHARSTYASHKADPKAARSRLDRRVDPVRPDSHLTFLNMTMVIPQKQQLGAAAAEGNLAEVKRLVALGAELEQESFGSGTPLLLAAECGHAPVVEFLIEKGSDIEAKGGLGGTALHWAATGGHAAVVEVLIREGASVEAKSEGSSHGGRTPLHWAENVAVARLLIDAGAGIDARDSGGDTPLHRAATFDRADVAELLIRKGAEVMAKSDSGETPLHEAGGVAVAKVLIDAGAEIAARDKKGKTPLHDVRKPAAAEFLIQKGAEIDAVDQEGHSPLIEALYWSRWVERRAEVALLLIRRGADVKIRARDGDTALHHASYLGLREIAGLLIGNGADVNAANAWGVTPLHYAASWGRPEVAKLLIRKGADIDAKTIKGETPLDFATRKEGFRDDDRKEVEAVLQKHGAKSP